MKFQNSHKSSGFTLIELLVVIAIIAILAAILFPAFAKARDNAKLSRCLVHLGQIGKAIQNYCDDNDARYPIGPSSNGSTGAWASNYFGGGCKGASNIEPKHRPLFKYTSGSLEIWRCPSEQRQPNGTGFSMATLMDGSQKRIDLARSFPFEAWGSSYVMNGVYAWDGVNGTSDPSANSFYTLMGNGYSYKSGGSHAPRKSSDVAHPTKIWMAGERTMHYYWAKKHHGGDMMPLGHMMDKPYSPVVFCDGHCQALYLQVDDLVDPNGKWAFCEKGWHPDPKWQNKGL